MMGNMYVLYMGDHSMKRDVIDENHGSSRLSSLPSTCVLATPM